MSPDGLLPETVEYPDHPVHRRPVPPELKSRPLDPHPLFASFVEAALEQSRLCEGPGAFRAAPDAQMTRHHR